MSTKDILKQAIKDFDGTVIVVSHDREFLDGLVEKVYEFGGGKVRECLGGIYEFLEKKKLASLQELEKKTTSAAPVPAAVADKESAPAPASAAKLSYAERKERDRIINRATKKVKEAEEEISLTEQKIAALEAELAAGMNHDSEIYNRHAELHKALDNAMSVWELASMELEELKEKYGL
jgi:ATP-binding cassette subfamily F protein 3